jgi:hypothetical protein
MKRGVIYESNIAEKLLEMYSVVQNSLDTAGNVLIQIY